MLVWHERGSERGGKRTAGSHKDILQRGGFLRLFDSFQSCANFRSNALRVCFSENFKVVVGTWVTKRWVPFVVIALSFFVSQKRVLPPRCCLVVTADALTVPDANQKDSHNVCDVQVEVVVNYKCREHCQHRVNELSGAQHKGGVTWGQLVLFRKKFPNRMRLQRKHHEYVLRKKIVVKIPVKLQRTTTVP